MSRDDGDRCNHLETAAVARYRRRSVRVDWLATRVFALGGLSVIGTLMLIVAYLVYQVLPLFRSPSMQLEAQFPLPAAESGASVYVAVELPAAVGFRLTTSGQSIYFSLQDGRILRQEPVPLPPGVSITSVAAGSVQGTLLALGLSNGSVVLLRHRFPGGSGGGKSSRGALEYPLASGSLTVLPGAAIEAVALAERGHDYYLMARSGDQVVALALQPDGNGAAPAAHSLDAAAPVGSGGTASWRVGRSLALSPPASHRWLLPPGAQRLLSLDAAGGLRIGQWRERHWSWLPRSTSEQEPLVDLVWLAGGDAFVTLSQRRRITQWMLLRPEGAAHGTPVAVREFTASDAQPVRVLSEAYRRVFLVLDAQGVGTLYHATSGRTLLVEQLLDARQLAAGGLERAALAADGRALLLESAGAMAVWRIENPHPEVSWGALWGKIHYEGYEQAQFVWQSTAVSATYEPKFSLMPLVFGTLKAACYALLVAVPLAVGGALYTAYFMAPAMRQRVKPVLELMEALPTVVIGFLAAIWLAPFIETHLLTVLLLPLVLPLATILLAFLCAQLPVSRWLPTGRYRATEPGGLAWLVLLLIPLIVLVALACYWLSPVLETHFFGGDFYRWLTQDLGVHFDQRNALLVGIALGFAVVPTIFSLAEDAIHFVPRHLAMGALALGARPWQVLGTVVLPTAAAGIFSAVMIGFGRVVGETMIVLMVTGNTPIMELNLFEGMRTLAANLAVEAPESALASTHLRVLFLAGLVLLGFTFVINTLAELVRQRLRRRYAEI